jgi:hypothetical protein
MFNFVAVTSHDWNLEVGRKVVGFDEKKLQIVIKVKITIVRPI